MNINFVQYCLFSANLLKYNNLLLKCKYKQQLGKNKFNWNVNNIWRNTSCSKGSNLLTEKDLDHSCSSFQRSSGEISKLIITPTIQSCEEKMNSEMYVTSMLKGNLSIVFIVSVLYIRKL